MIVAPDLSVPAHPEIFAIGDLATIETRAGLLNATAAGGYRMGDPNAKVKSGAGPDVVGLSIGIEDKEDLIADLEQALGA